VSPTSPDQPDFVKYFLDIGNVDAIHAEMATRGMSCDASRGRAAALAIQIPVAREPEQAVCALTTVVERIDVTTTELQKTGRRISTRAMWVSAASSVVGVLALLVAVVTYLHPPAGPDPDAVVTRSNWRNGCRRN
jgi:hypothetical protein